MPTVIKDVDKGAQRLLATFLRGLGGVKVGFQSDGEAGGSHDEAPGLTVLDVVTFHEFGLGVPRRSIVADWADERRAQITAVLKTQAERVAARQVTPAQALEQVGLWAQGDMRARMSRGIPPPLAQSTVDRKGSSIPLIDTGQTRASIEYQVTAPGERP